MIEAYPFRTDQISAPGLVPHIQELGIDLVGCELGVCRGHNLRYLLDRAPNIKKVYAIDPWKSYIDMPWGVISQEEVDGWKNAAVEILEPYKDKIEVLEMYSTDAVNSIPDNSLDYIFIDGDHSYEAVLRDVRAYWSKVKVGGLFTGHDWILDNVKRAVTEFREENNINTDMKFTDFHVWFWYKQ